MVELKRWAIAHKMYIGLYFLIAGFAYLDSKQIITFFELDSPIAWNLYNNYTLPAFITLWIMLIVVPGMVYYLFSKDKSETVGLIGAGLILLTTGFEDVMYFVFSEQSMTTCMEWFSQVGHPISYWSNLLGETCVSPTALISFSIVGILLANYIYKKLKRIRTW